MKTDEVYGQQLEKQVECHQAAVEKPRPSLVPSTSERKLPDTRKDISKDIDAKKKEFNHIQSERVRINQIHTEKKEITKLFCGLW